MGEMIKLSVLLTVFTVLAVTGVESQHNGQQQQNRWGGQWNQQQPWNRQPQEQNSKELKLLHIFYRHGIRAPADTYPNDPFLNNDFYPTGWGQVTNEGKRKLFEHGQYLRKRYGKFLGTHYSPELYYVQATDIDRTRVTAQAINSGLWAPSNDQHWGILNWNPIPVNYEPLNSDNLLLVRRSCPAYHVELKRVFNSPEIQRKLQAERDLMADLTRYTGKEIKDFEEIQDIYTTLMSEEAFGLRVPDWTRPYYPDRMYPSAIFSFVLNTYNDKLNRLKGGVLLKKLINDWKSVVDGTIKPKERKAFLYIGHDSTIVNLLSTLKVWDPQIPGFAINFQLEFSQDRYTQDYGLEIFFRNSTDPHAEPLQLKIPNCEKFCPLNRLIQLTEPVIPVNWEEECKTDDPDYVQPELRGP